MSSSLGFFASQISGHLFTLTGSYDALATVTVPSGGASSITFSAIPQTGYKHLEIRVTANSSTGDSLLMRFNGDSGSNYSRHGLYGNGTSALAFSGTSTTAIGIGQAQGFPSASNVFGGAIISVLDYTNASKGKTARILEGWDANGSGAIELNSGAWNATPTAINTIVITPQSGTINQYSTFSLYGVK